jgi:hypothetical protein
MGDLSTAAVPASVAVLAWVAVPAVEPASLDTCVWFEPQANNDADIMAAIDTAISRLKMLVFIDFPPKILYLLNRRSNPNFQFLQRYNTPKASPFNSPHHNSFCKILLQKGINH